jgi:hypothetical protein
MFFDSCTEHILAKAALHEQLLSIGYFCFSECFVHLQVAALQQALHFMTVFAR